MAAGLPGTRQNLGSVSAQQEPIRVVDEQGNDITPIDVPGVSDGPPRTGTVTSNSEYVNPPAPPVWIGQHRGVGRSPVSMGQRAAFDPMGNPSIRQGYNPMGNQQFHGVFNDARDLSNRADRERRAIEAMLGRPLSAPTFQAPRAFTPERVSAQTPGANLTQSHGGMRETYDQLRNLDASRATQMGAYDTAAQWAAGNMPSVGQGMADEAGAVANEQFQRAGSEATQAYGLAGNEANRSYADALAQMLTSQRNAAVGAARQTGDAASDSILRQAALTSAARGGNIGMALRSGLQGAAMQSADANRQGARLMADADRQAADIAAAGQRAAQSTQAQQALATLGTQERADFAAAGAELQARLRGAQIGSQEQQQGLALQAQIADQMRGGDVAGVGAANALAQTGLGMDTLSTNAAQSDADRMLGAEQFNAQQGMQNSQFEQRLGLDYDQLNAAQGLSYDQLNSQNQQFLAGMYQGDQQYGLGMQQGMTQFDAATEQALAAAQMGSQQQLVQLLTGLDESSRARVLQEFAIRNEVMSARDAAAAQQRNQMFGLGVQSLGAAGTVIAATGPLWMPSSGNQPQPNGGPTASSYPTGGPTYGSQADDPGYNPYGY